MLLLENVKLLGAKSKTAFDMFFNCDIFKFISGRTEYEGFCVAEIFAHP